MKTYFRRSILAASILAIATLVIVYAQQPKADEQMNKRGDHVMGFDHTKLTYRYSGRDYRLTDVFGNVVKDILA